MPDLRDQCSTIPFLGVPFSGLSLEQISSRLLAGSPSAVSLVVTCNMDHARELGINSNFRAAYRSATIVTMDGKPLQAYARIRTGVKVPHVTGADLFLHMFEHLDPAKHRPFFVTSSEEVGSSIMAMLAQKGFDPSACHYIVPPFGFERNDAATETLIETINAWRPSLVFFGVGAPKSEIWVWQQAARLPPAYYACFGAALEFLVGTKRRPPSFVGRLGMEWAWRVASEPRRLLRRYIQSFAFLLSLLCKTPDEIDLLNEHV